MEQILCPHCGAQATSDDFVCPKCEVILNATAEESPISVVQALLAPSNAPRRPKKPALPANAPEGATTRGVVVMDERTVPRLIADVEIGVKSLEPFEALVASFVDGFATVPEIAKAAEISKVEAAAVLQTLAFKDVIELQRNEPELQAAEPEEPQTQPIRSAAEVASSDGAERRPSTPKPDEAPTQARPSGAKPRDEAGERRPPSGRSGEKRLAASGPKTQPVRAAQPIKFGSDDEPTESEPKTALEVFAAPISDDLFAEQKTEPGFVRKAPATIRGRRDDVRVTKDARPDREVPPPPPPEDDDAETLPPQPRRARSGTPPEEEFPEPATLPPTGAPRSDPDAGTSRPQSAPRSQAVAQPAPAAAQSSKSESSARRQAPLKPDAPPGSSSSPPRAAAPPPAPSPLAGIRISAPTADELLVGAQRVPPAEKPRPRPLDEEYLFEPAAELSRDGKVVKADKDGTPPRGFKAPVFTTLPLPPERPPAVADAAVPVTRAERPPPYVDAPPPPTRSERPAARPSTPSAFSDFDVPAPVAAGSAPAPLQLATDAPPPRSGSAAFEPAPAAEHEAPLELARDVRHGSRNVSDISAPPGAFGESARPSPRDRRNARRVADISAPAVLPPSRTESALEQAVNLERHGDVDGAIRVLQGAIAGVRQPAPLYNKLALALVKRKQYREAATFLDKALTLEPENMTYRQNLRYVTKILID